MATRTVQRKQRKSRNSIKKAIFGQHFNKWDMLLISLFPILLTIHTLTTYFLSIEGMSSYYSEWYFQEIQDATEYLISPILVAVVLDIVIKNARHFARLDKVFILLLPMLMIVHAYMSYLLAREGVISYYTLWYYREISDISELLIGPLFLAIVVDFIFKKARM